MHLSCIDATASPVTAATGAPKRRRESSATRATSLTRNGRTTYLYADPNICVCVYVGTPEAYRVYQNGGPEGYVGDEANKSSPQFRVAPLLGEMAQDPYIDSPEGPSLDSYLDGNMP